MARNDPVMRQSTVASERLQAVHQGEACQAGPQKSAPVEGPAPVMAGIGDEAQGAGQPHDPKRHIEEKNPRPGGVGHDQAAERRPDHRRRKRRPGEQRDRADQVFLLGIAQHDEPPDRHHHGAADPLEDAGEGELPQRAARGT